MKFALVNGSRTEATKGEKGLCLVCNSDMIAKCGEFKINHWAHKGARNCDPWWENETEWHRSWKNNFAKEWQEVILTDSITGEKHIADIRSNHGLVVEFQHSPIDPQERRKREDFYKNMVWVVDGTRLKRDYSRFINGKHNLQRTRMKGIYQIRSPKECFPAAWLESSTLVLFDFRGAEPIKDPNDLRNQHLYCLWPQKTNEIPLLAVVPRQWFPEGVIKDKIRGLISR